MPRVSRKRKESDVRIQAIHQAATQSITQTTSNTTDAGQPTNSGRPGGREWTEEEKQTLLNAVLKYGTQNLEKIQSEVNTRSVLEILTFFRSLEKKYPNIANESMLTMPSPAVYHSERNCEEGPADVKNMTEWLKILNVVMSKYKDYSREVMAKYIHRKSAEVEAVGRFEAHIAGRRYYLRIIRIYQYLENLLNAKSSGLSTFECQVVLDLLVNVLSQARSVRQSGHNRALEEYVSNIIDSYHRNTLIAEDIGPEGNMIEKNNSSILDEALFSMNPAGIPEDLELPVNDVQL